MPHLDRTQSKVTFTPKNFRLTFSAFKCNSVNLFLVTIRRKPLTTFYLNYHVDRLHFKYLRDVNPNKTPFGANDVKKHRRAYQFTSANEWRKSLLCIQVWLKAIMGFSGGIQSNCGVGNLHYSFIVANSLREIQVKSSVRENICKKTDSNETARLNSIKPNKNNHFAIFHVRFLHVYFHTTRNKNHLGK